MLKLSTKEKVKSYKFTESLEYSTGKTKEFMKNERTTKPVGTKSHDLRWKNWRML